MNLRFLKSAILLIYSVPLITQAANYMSNDQILSSLRRNEVEAMKPRESIVLTGVTDQELRVLTQYLIKGDTAIPKQMNADPYRVQNLSDKKWYEGFNSIQLSDGRKITRTAFSAQEIVAGIGRLGRVDLLGQLILTPNQSGFGSYGHVHSVAVAETIKIFRTGNQQAAIILKQAVLRPSEPLAKFMIINGMSGFDDSTSLEILLSLARSKNRVISGSGNSSLDYTEILKLLVLEALKAHPLFGTTK